MIYLFSGTPGSGKSFHAVQNMVHWLKQDKNVIANFPLAYKGDNLTFLENEEITIEYLVDFARNNHEERKEGQTLLVIDEAQLVFNSRNWNSNASQRMDWIKFFSQHRKLGYTVILIAQFDRMIDRQIRCLIEYEVAHLKVNNFFRILPFSTFIAVHRWYGQKMKINHEIIFYRKNIAKLYDTFAMFDQHEATD